MHSAILSTVIKLPFVFKIFVVVFLSGRLRPVLLFIDVISVDGNWGAWSEWSSFAACSESCCGGIQNRTRTRVCDNPPPSGNGVTCPGPGTEDESQVCNEQTCPRK